MIEPFRLFPGFPGLSGSECLSLSGPLGAGKKAFRSGKIREDPGRGKRRSQEGNEMPVSRPQCACHQHIGDTRRRAHHREGADWTVGAPCLAPIDALAMSGAILCGSACTQYSVKCVSQRCVAFYVPCRVALSNRASQPISMWNPRPPYTDAP